MLDIFGPKSLLGLDIGSSSIKAVQLKDIKTGYELELFDYLPIQSDMIVDNVVANQQKLSEAIKALVKKAKIKAKNTVISISGHSSVIIKRITLPEMSEDVLNENIRYEAEQYVPFGIDDVNLDYQILGPAEEPGQIEVILVAVKKDALNSYIGAVKDAGLNPVIVDVDAFTLENMYEINYKSEGAKSVALLNVGASNTTINILKNGVSAFTRDSSIGSKHHTEALMREFSLNYDEAEQIKFGMTVKGITPEQADAVITGVSEEIVMEINHSLDFFSDSPEMEAIEGLWLGGGGAMVRGLKEKLSEMTGYPVTMLDPFKNIKIPKGIDADHIKFIAPIAAIAVGLATRRLGDR
ncbi:type IV pilus assembly protein PilM [Candidatus Magnetominusculus xianensis]|uniref:Pilus assembly protein PilM n=1 Tax=Candidatus Magnetominusculus xianensis TaxID=1748249 RepID=A0ABR5SJK4_9BACT|nr:type IV pilus assembly protein PilM [Candidatus Magnetominusculus xianensis]KWT91577.1 pilus assembly protein PilM [Candidatus Magnetominusculus xianensis]MBF0404362.1 type IV pilus assembly protein PilM [Nitrospirota bacterium]